MAVQRRKGTIASHAVASPQRLLSHIPGAEPGRLQAREALLRDQLAPRGAFEHSIVEDMVSADSELKMLRARRNMILWHKAAGEMYDSLRRKGYPDDAEALARAWAHGDAGATSEIQARGIDPETAHNDAYIKNILVIELLEKQIERLEKRRRQLLEDFQDLRQPERDTRAEHASIEDAEIVRIDGRE